MVRPGLVGVILLILTLPAIAIQVASEHPSRGMICLYYYPWYGGPDHPWVNVTEEPLLGYYNSSDNTVITQHLEWIKGLGVDCLFISWWGPGHYTDQVARLIYERLEGYGLKAAILIEPYLSRDASLYNASWWNQTLGYLKERFIERYPGAYLRLNGRPLVLAFNPIGGNYTPNEAFGEYVIRIVGNGVDGSGYKDWDLWPDYDKQLTGELRIRKDGYVALAPRFDDEHFRPGDVPQYDPDLSQGWYQKQWEWVLKHRDQVRIIAIYSWNEFHERSAIEPHIGPGQSDPYRLYNITRLLINALVARGGFDSHNTHSYSDVRGYASLTSGDQGGQGGIHREAGLILWSLVAVATVYVILKLVGDRVGRRGWKTS